jgi:hypothetical protein
MDANLKISISLILRFGVGLSTGGVLGIFLGFFMSAIGFDWGIWKIFWFVFWACAYLGMGIGFLSWVIWLRKSDL